VFKVVHQEHPSLSDDELQLLNKGISLGNSRAKYGTTEDVPHSIEFKAKSMLPVKYLPSSA